MSNFASYIQQIQNKDPNFKVNQAFIRKIDDRKTNVKKNIYRGFSAIFYAIYADNISAFHALYNEEKLTTNAELVVLNVEGQQLKLHPESSVLELAILLKNRELIKHILDEGDKELIERKNMQGVSTLMLLCLKGLPEFLSNDLLDRQLCQINSQGQNFTHYCCYFGSYECLWQVTNVVLYKGSVEMRVTLFRSLIAKDVQMQTPIELCFERLDINSMDENIIKGKRKCAILIRELLYQVLSSTDVKGYEQIRSDGIFQMMMRSYVRSTLAG